VRFDTPSVHRVQLRFAKLYAVVSEMIRHCAGENCHASGTVSYILLLQRCPYCSRVLKVEVVDVVEEPFVAVIL
jgi:hypothetical protein